MELLTNNHDCKVSPTFGDNFVPLLTYFVRSLRHLYAREYTDLVGKVSDTNTIDRGGGGSHNASRTGTAMSKNQASQNGLRKLVVFGFVWVVASKLEA